MEKSPSEDESKHTLVCRNIPPSLAKRQLLKEHFEQFGEVIRVLVSAEKGAASVEFSSHEQAAHARKLGTKIQSQEILITWKRTSSRTNSVDNSPGARSATLFGKALRSVVEKPTSVRSGPRPTNVTNSLLKREPISQGLYDDLPPPNDWNEDDRGGTQTMNKMKWRAKSAATGFTSATRPALFGKSRHIKTNDSEMPSTSGGSNLLFGKSIQTKSEPSLSGEMKVFGKLVQSKAEPAISSTQPSLFGKFVHEKTSAKNEPPKAVFGKLKTSQHSDDIAVGTQSSLSFGKPEGRHSVSPSRLSAKSRLSPARPGPTRSDSPFTPISATATFRTSPTPGPSTATFKTTSTPGPSVPAVALDDDDLTGAEIEWIMPSSLMVLKQTPAITCNERQDILDKREKLMRQGTSKQSDISKARATKGCCPDMCPERERYLREERRRVHVYEMVPCTNPQPQMNHQRAVKEYSRSSADQEEPLPLELRPAHVLAKTMTYMCNNILDIGSDGIWGEWYDFLWNRTRAVRKDITQQHLCSPVAAGLVEKCVRFHIYCGARLVEEDSMVFDTKINNENLTKCLQTLKEMYTDLLKRGVTCESEAEFRSYVVLMNLNEGDTLREVQQLRPAVRNSPQIKFALSAYAALNDKNYVKFFKLVKGTTVLNACILHRYFNQIRYEALKIILKAYSAAKGPALITFEQMVEVLHFESNDEGASFLQHYGLISSHSATSSSLSRDNFVEPDTPLSVTRSPGLVESKLTTTLGEAVYGQPLPPNDIPVPTSSFNEQGYFIGIIKPPQIDVEQQVPQESASSSISIPLNPPKQVVKDTLKLLIWQVLDVETANVAKETYAEEKLLVATEANDSTEILLQEVVQELCGDVATEVFSESQMERKIRLDAEKKLEMKICEEYISKLINQVQAEEVKQLVKETYRKLELEQRKAKCTNAVGVDMLHKHMVSMLEEIAKEVYQTDVVERLQQLERNETRVQAIRCRRFFRKWTIVYQNRTHLRRSMLTFPAAPPLLLPLKRNQDTNVPISKRCRLGIGANIDLVTKIQLSNIQKKLSLVQSNSPLNMTKTLAPVLTSDSNDSDYMKLIVSLPSYSSSDLDRRLSSWLTAKLSTGSVPERLLLSLYDITVSDDTRQPSQLKFGVCIRLFDAADEDSNTKLLLGANMAIFLLPFTKDADLDESYWEEPRLQLKSLLLRGLRERPFIPLLIISPLDLAKETIQHRMGVYDYLDNGLLSGVRVDKLDGTISYNEKLPEGIQWLISNRPRLPNLSLSDIKSLLETYLTTNFLCPVYQNLYERINSGLLHQDVEETINYFNDVIASLADKVVDDELYSWPVYEYNQGQVLSQDNVLQILETICLPPFNHSDTDDWYHACNNVYTYIDTVRHQYQDLLQRKASVDALLYSRVKSLLAKAESTFSYRCQRRFHRPPPLQPLQANVPWTDIILVCVEFAVSLLDENKMVVHDPLIGGADLDFPLGTDATYIETMVEALNKARKPIEEIDDSFIDLNTSMHAEPFSLLRTDLTDEMNASRHFEEILERALLCGDGASSIALPASVVDGAANDNISNCEEERSLYQIIQDEKEKSDRFEEYLESVLQEV